MRKTIILICIFPISAMLFCTQPGSYDSPNGYNFAQPKKYLLNSSLHEISGLVFLNNKNNDIGAIEDEDGRFYYFKPDDKEYKYTKFGKRGDFEDVSILNNQDIFVLRSDGVLFSFAASLTENKAIDNTREYKNILPPGEYEGMFADQDKLYVLCKNCPEENQKKEIPVFALKADSSGTLKVTDEIRIDLSSLHLKIGEKKPRIHPSCLAKHPLTHEWYIISSVNKLLIILDEQWKIKEHYLLDPVLFKQPEGIAFDAHGNLFVSNEGGDGGATILQFEYKQPKS